jgi:hypothetical protein
LFSKNPIPWRPLENKRALPSFPTNTRYEKQNYKSLPSMLCSERWVEVKRESDKKAYTKNHLSLYLLKQQQQQLKAHDS